MINIYFSIMKKLYFLIPVLILLFSTLTYAENKTCIYFFYGDGCPHCEKVEPFIDALSNRTDIEVQRFEIYHNEDNSYLLNTFFTVNNVPQEERGIPAVFIANAYLTGDVNIQSSLEKLIRENKGAKCPSPESIAEQPPAEKSLIAPWQIGAIIILTIVIVAGYVLYQKSK